MSGLASRHHAMNTGHPPRHSIGRVAALMLLVFLFCHPSLLADTDLRGLIVRLDKIRIPGRDVASKLEIRHSPKPAQPPETSAFQLYTRVSGEPGWQKVATLMICAAPPKDAGKRILFLDEACWFFETAGKNFPRPDVVAADGVRLSQLAAGGRFFGDAGRPGGDFVR